MNRLTAIGLASLVAYGLLIASKYTGFVSAAREDRAPQSAVSGRSRHARPGRWHAPRIRPSHREPAPAARVARSPCTCRPPRSSSAPRATSRPSPTGSIARRATSPPTSATTSRVRSRNASSRRAINEDLAAYSAKQRAPVPRGAHAGRPQRRQAHRRLRCRRTTRSAACASRAPRSRRRTSRICTTPPPSRATRARRRACSWRT